MPSRHRRHRRRRARRLAQRIIVYVPPVTPGMQPLPTPTASWSAVPPAVIVSLINGLLYCISHVAQALTAYWRAR